MIEELIGGLERLRAWFGRLSFVTECSFCGKRYVRLRRFIRHVEGHGGRPQ